MLDVNFLSEAGIIQIIPAGKVSKASVTKAAKSIKSYLAEGAQALLIETEDYEGWEVLASLIEPLIATDSRSAITQLAICTNKPTGEMGSVLRSLFAPSEVNIYCYFELEMAMQWLMDEVVEPVV